MCPVNTNRTTDSLLKTWTVQSKSGRWQQFHYSPIVFKEGVVSMITVLITPPPSLLGFISFRRADSHCHYNPGC